MNNISIFEKILYTQILICVGYRVVELTSTENTSEGVLVRGYIEDEKWGTTSPHSYIIRFLNNDYLLIDTDGYYISMNKDGTFELQFDKA